jgi:hypothetical protein
MSRGSGTSSSIVQTLCIHPLTAMKIKDSSWFFGPDRNGVELEVLALERGLDRFTVIHAMALNPKWRREYSWVTGWPRRSR